MLNDLNLSYLAYLNFNNIIQFIILTTIGSSLGYLLSIYVDNKSKALSETEEITTSKIVSNTIKISLGVTLWWFLFATIALGWDSIRSLS